MTGRFTSSILAACAMLSLGAEETILVKAKQRQNLSGMDDLARLQHLASGVGWEFEPDATTTAALQRIGIRSIRCINVDPIGGSFTTDGAFTVSNPANARLSAHLETCRQVGAVPHIILGTSLPPELRVPVEAQAIKPGIMGQQGGGRVFGPTDPARYSAYCEAYMTYVMVDQGFPEARFEFGNEPDIAGQFPYAKPPLPGMGSRALFDGYLASYKLVAAAADRVQEKHPGLKVRLGGPALAWAYTYRFGDFNWGVRFVEECAAQRIRIDFLGIHFYGNISPLDGQTTSAAGFPSFTSMLATLTEARDRCLPQVPIWMTEWGPTYHTAGPMAMINGDSMGATWCLAFLNQMLQSPIDGALFLVTTDIRSKRADGGWDNGFGWPSFFTNPHVTGGALPKAVFHAFDMVSRLKGYRAEATRPGKGVGCFTAADATGRCLRILAWNFDAKQPEGRLPEEQASRRTMPVIVADAGTFFGGKRVATTTWMVSPGRGDATSAFKRGETLTSENTAMSQVATGELAIVDERVATVLDLPPSSFALLEISAPTTPVQP